MSEEMTWDPQEPLTRMEGETPKSHAALHEYAVMGRTRSLRKLANHFEEERKKRDRGDMTVPEVPTTSFATLADWSSKYAWQNRVMQWEMLERLEEEELWKERRKVVREEDWTHASKLRELAERIIDAAPAFINRSRRVVDDGTPRVVDLEGNVVKDGRPREIVVTVALSITDLVRVEKIAMEMSRLAAEMDQTRQSISIDWKQEAENAGLDPAEVYEQLVKSYVANIRRRNDSTDSGSSEGSSEADGNK